MAQQYQIKSGDTLSEIAAKMGTTVSALMAANPQIKDPNKIYAGAVLNIPTKTTTSATTLITPEKQNELNEIANKIKAIQQQIPSLTKAVQDLTTERLKAGQTIPEIKIPTRDEIGELSADKSIQALQDLIAGGGYDKLLAQIGIQLSTALEEAREKEKTWMEKMTEFLGRRTKTEELMKRYEEEIKPQLEQQQSLLTEITSLNEQIANLKAEQQERLDKAEERLAPMTFIRGEQALIQRTYDRRIANLTALMGVKASLYDAVRGNIESARRWINDIVNAATYDQQFEWQVLSTMTSRYETEINQLGAEYRNWLNNLVDLKQNELRYAQEEKRQILEWMIQYPNAPWPSNSLNLSLEDAAKIARQGAAVKAAEKSIFTQTQLNKGAASAGIPIEDFMKLDDDTKNLYISGIVDDKKREIDNALKNYEDPSLLEKEISESNLPDAVKDTLVRYLKSKVRTVTPSPKPPETKKPWWKFW